MSEARVVRETQGLAGHERLLQPTVFMETELAFTLCLPPCSHFHVPCTSPDVALQATVGLKSPDQLSGLDYITLIKGGSLLSLGQLAMNNQIRHEGDVPLHERKGNTVLADAGADD